jgi:TetR/AcrR family tetracycline transcriptional repressor
LALTDAEGLEGLTVRRLAQRLGVTPMALYWHFKNKDELLDAVADRIWSLVDNEVDTALPWSAQLRTIMERLVAVLRAHPAASSLVMTAQPYAAEACFGTMEAALRILAEAGFTPAEGAALCRHGLRTATMLSIGDAGLTPKQTPEEAEEFLRHKRIALETLPQNRFPHVVEAASALAAPDDATDYFDFGVDLFIAGVEALAPRR